METPPVRRSAPPTRNPEDAAPLDLVLGGGSLLHQVVRELSTTAERRFAEFDVTAQQAALLIHAAQPDTTPNQLARRLGTDTAGMTRLLDRLETKGLLRRQRRPEDRRSIVIELTGPGRALVPRLAPTFGQVSRQLLAGFTATELRQLTAMLDRMLDNLGRPAAPGSAP
jgi:DNA-binding MarR family transcriptional regulator